MSQNPYHSDSDEWEVVDVISNSKTISTKSPKLKPQLSTSSNSGIQTQRLYNSSHGSLININVNNGNSKDEEKQSLLISSKITESRDLNDLNRKHDMKQSLYQTQLDIYKQKQKEYLQNWSKQQSFSNNNNNNNNVNNKEFEKIKNQKERQEEELRRMKDLCEKYLREKEKLETEISKQREHNQEMQKFTQQILENQSKYQLEHQKQILSMQNNNNKQQNNSNNNKNKNNNNNNINNNDSVVGKIFPNPTYNNNNIQDSNEFSVLNVEEDSTWQCSDCNFINDETSKFCKTCAKLNPIFGGSLKNNNNNNPNVSFVPDTNEPLLKNEGIVGEAKCMPCEKRQMGWILQNISNNSLIFNSLSLEILSESTNTSNTNKLEIDEIINKKLYKFDVKKNEEFYLFINFKAPSLPGKYTYFFNLYDVNKPNKKICKPLQLILYIKKKYNGEKEKKIKQLLQMNIGSDREQIVYLLEQNKWDISEAANALLEQCQE